MNIVFAGTPDFAVSPLQALLDSGHSVCAVYTQPDRPAGRGRKLQASPVKQLAEQHGLLVRQPPTLRDAEVQKSLAELAPDLMVVVAYGLLLPPEVLSMPLHGCVNVHASLLPRWRGAAPIQQAILTGDPTTGITLMQMDAGLDTGDILAQATCSILDTDTATDLHDRLSALGAGLLGEHLPALLSGKLRPKPQNNVEATHAGKIKKADGLLNWTLSAQQLDRMVRAFHPWPVSYTHLGDDVLRIWRAQIQDQAATEVPGTVIAVDNDGIDVACGQGVLRVLEVQLPGGRRIAASDLAHSRALDGVQFQAVSG